MSNKTNNENTTYGKELSSSQSVRYQILDQRRGDYVNIRDLKQDVNIVMHAYELACDRNMIRHFSAEDACLIGIIAGQSIGDNK